MEVPLVEQSVDHALWNLACGLCVELEAGREYEPIVEPVNICRHAGADKCRSLDHRGTGEAAIRMTIFQPKERHTPNLAPRHFRSGGVIVSRCRVGTHSPFCLSSSSSFAKSIAICRASSIVMMPVCPALHGARP
jgi:hypothetical protein